MTANKKKERRTAQRKKDAEKLGLKFWFDVALIVPAVVAASIADWASEWYDRTFIWGAVPENRKKKDE